MLKLDTKIDLDMGQFFRWWGGELAFLVPKSLVKFLGAGRTRLIVTRDGNGVSVRCLEGQEERLLGHWPLDADGQSRRETLFADNPELAEAQVILQLASSQALVKTFKLPAVAEENLQQVAAFEMDRLTPFKAASVYYDVKLLERLPETRQIRVELALIPKGRLDEFLDELIAAGWRPERVDVSGGRASHGHDLLPDKFRPPKNRLPGLLALASGALLTTVLIAVLALPIVMKQKLLKDLQMQTKAMAKMAAEVQELKEGAEKLSNENGFLLNKKRHEPVLVDMLDELTKVIPDTTSLNGLQYREHKVILQGQSPTASSLIEKMEASPYFKNTSFVSPVTKDVSNGQERFQIASEVLNGRFSESPAE